MTWTGPWAGDWYGAWEGAASGGPTYADAACVIFAGGSLVGTLDQPQAAEKPNNLHPINPIRGYFVRVGDKRFVVETEAEFRRLVAKFESNDLPKLKKQVRKIPDPVVIEAEPIQAAAPVDTALADRLFARIQRWNKTLERLRAEAMLRKMAQDEEDDEAALMLLM